MSRSGFDILVLTDPRFSGGTASAVISDVARFSELGLSVGLMPIRSRFFDGTDDLENPHVLKLQDLPGVSLATGTASAELTLLHHPLAFFHGLHTRAELTTRRAVVVTHHPPFRGDGSLEYNPLTVNRQISRAFGCHPWWAPVSGTVRAQLRSFAPLLTLTSEDWTNTFDPDEWRSTRPAFSGPQATVGRHGRADSLKWPDDLAAMTAPLSPGPAWRTRVMGLPDDVRRALGPAADAWEIVRFNAEPVGQFLESLDAFCYFYHPRWIEAFGRTIAEAILMERPCVLDPRLRANFGDLGHYCAPGDAADCLARLHERPEESRQHARDARERAITRFGNASVDARLRALMSDPGMRSRHGAKSTSASTTLRKIVGLARRQRARTTPEIV
ncbi:glycosyltransferase [Alloyangia pacifica]|uniref:glycosyltransferase n=1 Tax=Alloyangia pacifica TaxID=311180 RepID=UPI001CFF2112|nr:glycosyltransferase family 1 protein [Alloyangia pacifica]